MKKNAFILVIIWAVLSSFSQAQNLRIMSLGGVRLALSDEDNSLNIYDFGGNPAWLINDDKENWLKVTPSFNRNWGDYRRLYDSRSSSEEGISFTGLKPMGEKGTFLGRARYTYETRKDVPGSLEYNPYGGEAFRIADTTKGDFRYDGPGAGFIYSFELLPGLFTGIEADYSLLDGLKDRYSLAKTLLRDVRGKLGLAYAFRSNLVLGADFELLDTQEALDMEDALAQNQVEIYNYRGENYYTKVRRLNVKEKIRRQAEKIGSEVYFRPLQNLEAALNAQLTISRSMFFIPKDGLKEFKEASAANENYSLEFRSRYNPTGNLTFGTSLGYNSCDSWTENSGSGLLLWQWNLKRTSLGAGTTYKIEPLDIMLGFDYEAELIKADSSKFIDVKFINVSALNNSLRLGAEYRLMNDFYVRGGYSFGKREVDLISGGRNVAVSSAIMGIAINMFRDAKIDFMIGYGNEVPSGYNDISRRHFTASMAVRLNSF